MIRIENDSVLNRDITAYNRVVFLITHLIAHLVFLAKKNILKEYAYF